VDPDVAEPLKVEALCDADLGFLCSNLYNDVTEVSKGEYSL
jgi:hypothetical protein